MNDSLYINVKDFFFSIVRFCVGDTDIEELILHHKGKRNTFYFHEYMDGWQHKEPFFQLLETCEVDLYTLSVKKSTNSNAYHIWLKPVDEKTWKTLVRYGKKAEGVGVC